MKKPELKISILCDYIYPFCFIGNLHLGALRDIYTLKINWCFIETHPETLPEGGSVKTLNYANEVWDKIIKELKQLADEEGIKLHKQTIMRNSRKALLLSDAVNPGRRCFYPCISSYSLHISLKENIGDETVLRDIAKENNIPENLINQTWSDEYANGPANATPAGLLPYLQYAGYLQAKSVPTFIFDNQVLNGAVSRKKLLQTASQML